MASNRSSRSGVLTAGGVLSIVGGALQIIGGLVIAVIATGIGLLLRLVPIPFPPGIDGGDVVPFVPFWLIVVGVPLLALGMVAIVGGVSAIRRGSFGLSLAGAICALPSVILGILAVIFVSVSKGEFGTKE
jgi:hypothetical protein